MNKTILQNLKSAKLYYYHPEKGILVDNLPIKKATYAHNVLSLFTDSKKCPELVFAGGELTTDGEKITDINCPFDLPGTIYKISY